MDRLAGSDVDAHLGPALQEAPQLYGPTERLKRALTEGREQEALLALDELEEAVDGGFISPGARRAAERGIREAREALSPEAYWRQRTWKRVFVIFAGPGTNLLFAIVCFSILLAFGPGQGTTTVAAIETGRPAAEAGLHPGDQVVAINGKSVDYVGMFEQINASQGKPVQVTVEREGRRVTLPMVRPFKDTDGRYRLGFR